jgi:hypothetical protein
MTKQVVIIGKCGADEDAKALDALVRFVSDTHPDELVCIEQSIPLLERLREVYDGSVGVNASNLEARFGTTALPDYYSIAPGWISTSRDDCCAVSRIAGNTALNAAKKLNTCVVLGRTGRMGIGSYTTGYGGDAAKTITGMEVGNLMDVKLASSLNGQQGFGILTVDGDDAKAQTVPITRGRFTVDGGVWEV